jgi:WD40 repeat protein
MLASVGLDSTVWIWDGVTFGELKGALRRLVTANETERIQKLDRHQGSVKGVCWDPVGNFLATQVNVISGLPSLFSFRTNPQCPLSSSHSSVTPNLLLASQSCRDIAPPSRRWNID